VLDGQGESDVATAGRSGACAHITWQEVSERARMHMTFVAWQGLRPVGLLGLDEAGLVSMFFVRRGEAEGSHGLGVAMALMARAEEACTAAGKREIMVHSSPRAQTFYEWLGFGATDGPQEAERFVFVPMAKRL
jgi:GNAT superfamily N-acetyltransferase